MGKGRWSALLIAVAILTTGLVRTGWAVHGTGDHEAFSGGATFKGLVVKTAGDAGTPVSITAVVPAFQTIDSRGFQIPAGDSQLIVVDINTLMRCAGTFGNCHIRAVVGRTLGSAVELKPGLSSNFMEIAGESVFARIATSKALCVQNATGSPINISVWFQAGENVLSGDPEDLDFDVADWTFKIARNSTCSPTTNI